MVEADRFNAPQLIEAVCIWTGWGSEMMPRRDDVRLAKRFGDKLAAELLSAIRKLEEDFYSSDARHVAANLQEMATLSAEHFKKMHPTISDEIVKAFAWCYTFDFK